MKRDSDLCLCGHTRADHCGCGCQCMFVTPEERARADAAREAGDMLQTFMHVACDTCVGFRKAEAWS